jgi:hypothetical protein
MLCQPLSEFFKDAPDPSTAAVVCSSYTSTMPPEGPAMGLTPSRPQRKSLAPLSHIRLTCAVLEREYGSTEQSRRNTRALTCVLRPSRCLYALPEGQKDSGMFPKANRPACAHAGVICCEHNLKRQLSSLPGNRFVSYGSDVSPRVVMCKSLHRDDGHAIPAKRWTLPMVSNARPVGRSLDAVGQFCASCPRGVQAG